MRFAVPILFTFLASAIATEALVEQQWISLDNFNGSVSEALIIQQELFRTVILSHSVTSSETINQIDLDKRSILPFEVSSRNSLSAHQLKHILKERSIIHFKDKNTLLIPDKEYMGMSPKKLSKRMSEGGTYKFHEVRYNKRSQPKIDESYRIPALPCMYMINGKGQGSSVLISFTLSMSFQGGTTSSASIGIGGLPTYLSLGAGGGLSTTLSKSSTIALGYGCQSISDKPFRLFYHPSVVEVSDSEREVLYYMASGQIKNSDWVVNSSVKLFSLKPPSLFCGYAEEMDVQCDTPMSDIPGEGENIDVLQTSFSVKSDGVYSVYNREL